MDNFNSEPRVVNTDERGLNAHIRKVFSYMAMAMLVTAATAFVAATSMQAVVIRIFSSMTAQLMLMAVLLGVVWIFSRRVFTNPAQAFGLLMAYSVLNGFIFSIYGMLYDLSMIGAAFLTTAFLFVGMAFWGFVSKKDMSGMGSILFGSVIALIIGSVINLIWFNSIVYLAISVIGVIVFALLTAFDMNKIKSMYTQYGQQGDATLEQGLAISGAMNLYMDFVNMFLYILRLFTAFGSND